MIIYSKNMEKNNFNFSKNYIFSIDMYQINNLVCITYVEMENKFTV